LHSSAIEAGVRELRKHGILALAPFNLVAYELLEAHASKFQDILAPITDPEERAHLEADFALDFHAGFGETSVTLHYAPESVSPDYTRLPPCPRLTPQPGMLALSKAARLVGKTRLADELGFAASGMGWYALRPFPGYTSRPHLANAKSGAALAKVMVDRFEHHAREVFAGRALSPEPVMQWMSLATLGGRAFKLDIPESEVERLAAS
jgi:creatinine amidohydrolase/Fe(II)-dependent formamide hydrolase-like protein